MRQFIRTIALSLLGLHAAQAWAAAGDPAGSEFQVSTTSTVNRPDVAIDDSGNFVAVWQGAGGALWMQRHNSSGARLGTESAVQTGTTNAFGPRVASDANGNYAVTWQGTGTGDSDGIFVRLFNASGVAQGSGPVLVNTTTAGFQGTPDIAMNASGAFVVTWFDIAGVIRAQRFNAAGVAQGSEFTVSTNTTGSRSEPGVAIANSGAFIVVWQSDGDGDQSGIYGRRYDSSGVALTGEVLINASAVGAQTYPAVAMNASGAYVVTWFTWDGSQVLAQRFGSGGSATGAPLTVSAAHVAFSGPDVGIDDTGNFLVTWERNGAETPSTPFSFGVFARYFLADGTAGAVQQINTAVNGDQHVAAVSMDTDGDAIVVWETAHLRSNQDIFGRRYAGTAVADTTPDPFSFAAQTNVALSTVVTSAAATISGINAAATISIVGGEYSIGCTGTFTAAAGTITSGQTICVRHTSSASFNTGTQTALTIGGVLATFSSTTLAQPADTTPDAFSFAPRTGVATATTVTSAAATITGINAAAAISVTGGEFSVGCTTTFTAAAGTISTGQAVCVRHTSAASAGTSVSTTLTVGGVTAAFTSTTAGASSGGGGATDFWMILLLACLIAASRIQGQVRTGSRSRRTMSATSGSVLG